MTNLPFLSEFCHFCHFNDKRQTNMTFQKQNSDKSEVFANVNRSFPSSPGPLFQNEGRCSVFDIEIIFLSHTNKTHFHKKGCAPSLILKVRVSGTRKWPILVCLSEFRVYK